ncbi:unnamed protein product, partial [Amoebophrya sp. A120]
SRGRGAVRVQLQTELLQLGHLLHNEALLEQEEIEIMVNIRQLVMFLLHVLLSNSKIPIFPPRARRRCASKGN